MTLGLGLSHLLWWLATTMWGTDAGPRLLALLVKEVRTKFDTKLNLEPTLEMVKMVGKFIFSRLMEEAWN
jgi:hypothetical protein